jgi:hypothetical protein
MQLERSYWQIASTIRILPMTDAGDADDSDLVSNFVDNPIVSDSDAPVVFRADEFPAALRAGIFGEGYDGWRQLRPEFWSDSLEILFRRTLYENLEHGC